MQIDLKIIVVGRVKEEYFRNKIEEYVYRLNKKHNIEVIELMDESIPKNAGESVWDSIKEKEGRRILERIDNNDYVVALCIDGKMTDSEGLAGIAAKSLNRGAGSLVFIIGGSLGLHDCVVRRADYRLSFSRMTFPHQLMRVMLLEQLADYL